MHGIEIIYKRTEITNWSSIPDVICLCCKIHKMLKGIVNSYRQTHIHTLPAYALRNGVSNVYCKNVIAPSMWFMKMWYHTHTHAHTHTLSISKKL